MSRQEPRPRRVVIVPQLTLEEHDAWPDEASDDDPSYYPSDDDSSSDEDMIVLDDENDDDLTHNLA